MVEFIYGGFVFIIVLLIFIFMNFSIIIFAKNAKIGNSKMLYSIHSKNIWNKFILCSLLLNFIINIIDVYELFENEIYQINIFPLIIFLINCILSIVLLISTIILLCFKSKICDDTIISSEGIFKISTIKKIEKDKNIIKVFFKKYSPYALLGYKSFIVRENNIDEIYDFIYSKIVE